MFKKLFGGGKDGASTAPVAPNAAAAAKTINTIQQLTDHEESLEKRKTLLEKRIEAELEKARGFTKQQKKPQALQCLKKKKLLEQEVLNLDNMIMRVIEQRSMLESQSTTVQVVSTMHAAAGQAKKNLAAMNIDNIDKVMDEINETREQMQQINEAMGQSAVDLDEDELLGELEEMEATEMDKELLAPAPVPTTKVPAAGEKLPSAPATKVKPTKTPEEAELEALQAELAL